MGQWETRKDIYNLMLTLWWNILIFIGNGIWYYRPPMKVGDIDLQKIDHVGNQSPFCWGGHRCLPSYLSGNSWAPAKRENGLVFSFWHEIQFWWLFSAVVQDIRDKNDINDWMYMRSKTVKNYVWFFCRNLDRSDHEVPSVQPTINQPTN